MGRMYRFAAFPAAIVLLLTVLTTSPLQAQENKRAEDTGYFKARVGFSAYGGDINVGNESEVAFGAVGGEIGYQFSPVFGAGIGLLRGTYPEAEAIAGDSGGQYHWQLLLNFFPLPNRTLTPYFLLGGHVTTGTPGDDTGYGPLAGVGFDVSVSDRVSIFAEAHSNMVFPDEAMDGRDAGDASYDMGHFLGAGLRVTFDKPFVPVDISSVQIPNQLETGEEGTFTVEVGPEATQPLQYTWEFGDGTQADSQTVTHAYQEADDYDVSVTVSNRESQVSESATVSVLAPPEIVTMNADPTTPETGQSVEFTADVQGSDPLSYSWNIDGETFSEEAPTQTFEDAGSYTIELSAENEVGQDQASITVTVEPAIPPVCEQLMAADADLNTVHFDFDVAELDEEAQGLLDENVGVLNQCTMVNVLLEGYADQVGPSQYNVRLSQRRAENVQEFYVNEGISLDRLSTEGLGEAPNPCLKEDPGPGCRQNRRVESIPEQGAQ